MMQHDSTMAPGGSTLRRELGLLDAVGVGFGAIIGAGIFVVTGVAAGIAGPAFLRESPQDNPLASPIFQESLNHWGANFGIEAEIPTAWQSLSLVAGVEDFVVFWNDVEAARRVDRFAAQDGFVTETVIDTDPSHMLVLRAGLSLRLQ